MLDGNVALVTGATRGIGKAIAETLARDGATVVGTATTDEGAASITAFLQAAQGGGQGMKLDVTDAKSVSETIADIQARLGEVTILVNNAGITRDNLLVRMKDDEWDAILDTNLKSAYRLSKAVLRGMMKARRGRIINIGSVVGVSGNAGQTNYSAAKAALVGFTKVAGSGSRQPRDYGELRRAGLHRHRHDALAGRGAACEIDRAHPAGTSWVSSGRGARRRVSRLSRGRVCHRRDIACQRRHVYAVAKGTASCEPVRSANLSRDFGQKHPFW